MAFSRHRYVRHRCGVLNNLRSCPFVAGCQHRGSSRALEDFENICVDILIRVSIQEC